MRWIFALFALPASLPYMLTELVPGHLQLRLGERMYGAAYHAWLPCGCHPEIPEIPEIPEPLEAI